MNHKSYTKDHVGPVVVSHRNDEHIKAIILEYVNNHK